jgi:hypothetical protein
MCGFLVIVQNRFFPFAARGLAHNHPDMNFQRTLYPYYEGFFVSVIALRSFVHLRASGDRVVVRWRWLQGERLRDIAIVSDIGASDLESDCAGDVFAGALYGRAKAPRLVAVAPAEIGEAEIEETLDIAPSITSRP